MTAIHILPGLLFVVLAPLQFVKSLRKGRLHRWLGRALVAVGLVIGVSALLMSAKMSIGGLTETTATMSFGALFLFCLVRGFVAHPPPPDRTTPRVDAPRLRHRHGRRLHPPHRRHLLRYQPSHPPDALTIFSASPSGSAS